MKGAKWWSVLGRFTFGLVAALGGCSSDDEESIEPLPWGCTTHQYLDEHCSCNRFADSADESPTDSCNAGTFGSSSICCHRVLTPGTHECWCEALRCVTDGTSCSCGSFNLTSDGTPTATCTGAICCLSTTNTSCGCGDQPCTGDAVQVAECTVASLTCGEGRTAQADCTVEPTQ
jgi:hypothetical protein